MARLETEVKQITHAIRIAAYNAETTLARALHGHYARAEDEAYALIREALTASGDIIPGHGELLIRLDPLTAPRRTRALAALCQQTQPGPRQLPRNRPDPALRSQRPPRPCMILLPMSGVLAPWRKICGLRPATPYGQKISRWPSRPVSALNRYRSDSTKL